MFYALDQVHRKRMSGSRLPPEISDSIVDLLHDEPQALEQCCLVSKSWVPRTRRYLFRRIQFQHYADVSAWKKAFPNPANSPAYYTHSLVFSWTVDIIAEEAGGGSWIRAFSDVVRLEVINGMSVFVRLAFSYRLESACIVRTDLSTSKLLILICSLPVLEDLRLACPGTVIDSDNDATTFRPSTLPPLTGTLALSIGRGMECTARRLLDLHICVRFRRLCCTWWCEEEAQWIVALVKACSDTLEYVGIEDSTPGKLGPRLDFCYVVP